MNFADLLECGNCFVLCKHCEELTLFQFTKCHRCKEFIEYENYAQFSSFDKYLLMIEALMKFEVNKVEGSYSMITIEIKNNRNSVPELWQICKTDNKYNFMHYEKDTHKRLENDIIYPQYFFPVLNPNNEYQISLSYGPHVIYVSQ